jgi:hypothetical protein
MAKNDNLTDFLTDVADAIREKKGTTEKINPQEFSNEIASIKTSSSIWTGHVDVEGLKAIGWDDNDIAYFQEHGVNWMEEDDEFHKVPEDNKALYGVINYSNYKDYKDIIEYLPKFDMSTETGYDTFADFKKMVAMPLLELPNLKQLHNTFYDCQMLTCIPPAFDGFQPIRARNTFVYCYSISELPDIDFSKCMTFTNNIFSSCFSLKRINKIIIHPEASINSNIIYNCVSLESVGEFDISGHTEGGSLVFCNALKSIKLKHINHTVDISRSFVISKESIIYMIENEAASSAITIKLRSDVYARLATDPDIVAALAEHPLVSLASA